MSPMKLLVKSSLSSSDLGESTVVCGLPTSWGVTLLYGQRSTVICVAHFEGLWTSWSLTSPWSYHPLIISAWIDSDSDGAKMMWVFFFFPDDSFCIINWYFSISKLSLLAPPPFQTALWYKRTISFNVLKLTIIISLLEAQIVSNLAGLPLTWLEISSFNWSGSFRHALCGTK